MTENAPKGFSIAIDAQRHIIKVRGWGFWDLELARKYGTAFMEKSDEVHHNGENWSAIVDFRSLFPRSEEVQIMLNQHFITAEQQGLNRIGCLGEQSALQLLLRATLNEQNVRSAFFNTEAEALRWLTAHNPEQGEFRRHDTQKPTV